MKKIISVILVILMLTPAALAADRVNLTAVNSFPAHSVYINDMIFVRESEYTEEADRHYITAYNSDGDFMWKSEVTGRIETFGHEDPVADPMIYEGKNGIIVPNGVGVKCLSYKDGSVVWNYSVSLPYVRLNRICSDNNGGVYAVWSKDYTDLNGDPEDYMDEGSYYTGLWIIHISPYGVGDQAARYEIGDYWEGTHVNSVSYVTNRLVVTGSYNYDKPFITKFTLYESGGALEPKTEVLPDKHYDYVADPYTGFLLGINPRDGDAVLLDRACKPVFTHTCDYSFGPYGFLNNGDFYITEYRSEEDRNNGIVYLTFFDRQENTGTYIGNTGTYIDIEHKLDVYNIKNIMPNVSGGYTVEYYSAGESGLIFYSADFAEEGRQVTYKVGENIGSKDNCMVSGDRVIYFGAAKKKSANLHSEKHPLNYVHDEVF